MTGYFLAAVTIVALVVAALSWDGREEPPGWLVEMCAEVDCRP